MQTNDLLRNLSPQAQLELAQRRIELLRQQRYVIPADWQAVPWIEKHFYVPELKGPIQLAPYQKAVLNEALTPQADGTFKYSTIIWSDIKKSIKSCIAAAVGLWRANSIPWGSIYAIANDLKGADSRVGFYMRRAIELYPPLREAAHVRGYRIEFPNHAFIESVPIDPSGEAGSNADMTIWSELWGAHEEGQQRMWTEFTIPPAKFGHAFRWVETYAGFSGESLLLEQLYDTGVKHGEWLDLGIGDLPVFVNREARMLVMWNDRPRLKWQTSLYYREQEATLVPSEFRRVHLNQWVSSSQKFVPDEWWDACHWKAQGMSEMPPDVLREPWVIGIDAGVSNDHFGVVGWTRHKDQLICRYVNEWIPPKHGKIDFAGPEMELQRLAKEHNVLEFAYDITQLHDMATRLRRAGLGYFRDFPQGMGSRIRPGRPIADKQFYDVIQRRRIVHDGNAILREHILNANAEIEGDEARLRLVKRSPLLKIDCAVASSMAISELLRLNLG